MNLARRYAICWLFVWTVAWAFSLDIADPYFRPFDRLYDPETRRFQKNQMIEMRKIGDLGYTSWIRELQSERITRFSTDRFGFRNPPNEQASRVVVVGDSFVAGAGLSDAETLSARMSHYLGENVYNFGTQYLNGPALFLRETRFATHRPEFVVWAPVARSLKARALFYRDWSRPTQAIPAAIGSSIERGVTRINERNALVREARFLLQGIRYRVDGYRQARTLQDGTTVLTLSLANQGLQASIETRELPEMIKTVVLFKELLGSAGIRFLFCPIPESGTIYPELFSEEERRDLAAPDFLGTLITGLRQRGVETVDLRDTFSAHRNPYLYQVDDSHWSPRAVDLAAEVLSETITGSPRGE